MSNQASVNNLLNNIEFDDPRLYDLLKQLINDNYAVYNSLFPPVGAQEFGTTGQLAKPVTPTGLISALFNNNLKLSWDNISAASYELRYKAGNNTDTVWDTATVILTTSTLSADINPLTIPLTTGVHTFLLKGIGSNGEYSNTAAYITVTIGAMAAPVVTSTVVTNFVLLSWTTPIGTWLIDHYNVYKNGTLEGQVKGTFEAIFESAGGTYTYRVEAVDIVGNVSALSVGLVLTVSNPADYTLQATIVDDLSGTKVNCVKEMVSGTAYLLACVDTAKTWSTHFSTPVWANIQAQITAGYPLYCEPSLTTGSYVQIFNFGSLLTNIIASVNWNQIDIVGSVGTGTTTVETSTDGITWSTPVTGTSIFAASMQYVRLTMNFTGSSDKVLSYFYNIQCLLNVKLEQDGGIISAVSTDVGGTTVTFTKSFKSIKSIALAAVSTVERKVVYDFAFPVNPTTFKILLFNAAGARVTGDVTWIARGIL